MSKQKLIDVIQWILIIGLSIVLLIGFIRQNKAFTKNAEYEKNNTYVKIYESQNISKLKKENKALYDSIKKLKNVESAIEIRYKYRYKTDTVYLSKSVKQSALKDSVYDFRSDNDTVSYELKVKAKDVDWYSMNFAINDKFTIINRNDNDQNETTVIHSPNVSIEGTTMYHSKDKYNKWYNRFSVGPQIGVGVNTQGQINPYIGFGVTYNLLRK